MNPKIRWLQVFGVPLVFMGAVGGLGGSTLSAGRNISGNGETLTLFVERKQHGGQKAIEKGH